MTKISSNGRGQKKIKMEDDPKKSKWRMTKKSKMEDEKKKKCQTKINSHQKITKISSNGRGQKKRFND